MPYDEALLKDATKHYWNVTLYDKPASLTDRNTHMPAHKERLTQFKAQHPGVINFGGPMLDADSHAMVGTVFVLKRGAEFPTCQAVETWIEEDPYHQNGVWVRRQIGLFLALTTPASAAPPPQ